MHVIDFNTSYGIFIVIQQRSMWRILLQFPLRDSQWRASTLTATLHLSDDAELFLDRIVQHCVQGRDDHYR